MKATIIELPKMKAICFDGFLPDPEMKAFARMKDWLDQNKVGNRYRIFGYNIDAAGNLTYDPQNAGYRVLLVIDGYDAFPADFKTEVIYPGKFLSLRVEGNINNVEQWLPEGWTGMNKTIQDENLKVRKTPRWYEEHIKTENPDYMIVDLYLELE